MSIEEYLQELETLRNTSITPNCERLPEDYITDENESVIWNREQVELNHEQYDEEKVTLETNKEKK